MCAAMLNVCLARCWFDTPPRGELRGAVAGLHGDRGPLPRFVARLLALGARSSALTNLASVQLCSRLLLAPALVPCYADEVCRLSFLACVRDCSGTAPGCLQRPAIHDQSHAIPGIKRGPSQFPQPACHASILTLACHMFTPPSIAALTVSICRCSLNQRRAATFFSAFALDQAGREACLPHLSLLPLCVTITVQRFMARSPDLVISWTTMPHLEFTCTSMKASRCLSCRDLNTSPV